jgi:hypothetical protein
MITPEAVMPFPLKEKLYESALAGAAATAMAVAMIATAAKETLACEKHLGTKNGLLQNIAHFMVTPCMAHF